MSKECENPEARYLTLEGYAAIGGASQFVQAMLLEFDAMTGQDRVAINRLLDRVIKDIRAEFSSPEPVIVSRTPRLVVHNPKPVTSPEAA